MSEFQLAVALYVLGMFNTAALCVVLMGWTRRVAVAWLCILLWPALSLAVVAWLVSDKLRGVRS